MLLRISANKLKNFFYTAIIAITFTSLLGCQDGNNNSNVQLTNPGTVYTAINNTPSLTLSPDTATNNLSTSFSIGIASNISSSGGQADNITITSPLPADVSAQYTNCSNVTTSNGCTITITAGSGAVAGKYNLTIAGSNTAPTVVSLILETGSLQFTPNNIENSGPQNIVVSDSSNVPITIDSINTASDNLQSTGSNLQISNNTCDNITLQPQTTATNSSCSFTLSGPSTYSNIPISLIVEANDLASSSEDMQFFDSASSSSIPISATTDIMNSNDLTYSANHLIKKISISNNTGFDDLPLSYHLSKPAFAQHSGFNIQASPGCVAGSTSGAYLIAKNTTCTLTLSTTEMNPQDFGNLSAFNLSVGPVNQSYNLIMAGAVVVTANNDADATSFREVEVKNLLLDNATVNNITAILANNLSANQLVVANVLPTGITDNQQCSNLPSLAAGQSCDIWFKANTTTPNYINNPSGLTIQWTQSDAYGIKSTTLPVIAASYLYAGTTSTPSLLEYDPTHGWTTVPGVIPERIQTLAFDAKGNLYTGSDYDGDPTPPPSVNRLDPIASWQPEGPISSMPPRVYALAFDHNNNLYAGSITEPVKLINANTPNTWQAAGSTSAPIDVDALAFDQNGNLYAGINGPQPMEVFNPNTQLWSTAPGSNSQAIPDWVSDILIDSHGNIYTASSNVGATIGHNFINEYVGGNWNILGGTAVSDVVSLALSPTGTLYAGSIQDQKPNYQSITQYDPATQQWVQVGSNIPPGLANDPTGVMQIVADRQNDLFAGTYQSGIYEYNATSGWQQLGSLDPLYLQTIALGSSLTIGDPD